MLLISVNVAHVVEQDAADIIAQSGGAARWVKQKGGAATKAGLGVAWAAWLSGRRAARSAAGKRSARGISGTPAKRWM
jgi:hypothetical protein